MRPDDKPTTQPQARGPLADVRVLDISSFLAAPMAATWLADFGADVVKVEHPRGDMMRSWGSTTRDGVPLFWKVVGRNKRTSRSTCTASRISRSLKSWLPRPTSWWKTSGRAPSPRGGSTTQR